MEEREKSLAGRAATHTRRGILDLVSQTSGVVLVLIAAVIFAAAAVAGLSLVPALGTFGWVAYFVVLAVLALSLGPVIATGVTVRLKGSPRHRAEMERRIEEQRRKFGLVTQARPLDATRDRSSARVPGAPAPAADSDSAVVRGG